MPPIALLAAVHGIALAVRGGASGRVYRWAVTAVAAIGVGAFAVSFLALSDLMRVIGYSSANAWIFPTIIDTAVAVSTLMLVALGNKPARRTRTGSAQTPAAQRTTQPAKHGAKAPVKMLLPTSARIPTVRAEKRQTAASQEADPARTVQNSAQSEATQVDAELASKLIASGATTQPVSIVIAVLAASRDGASINAAAKASGINYRTAQRIVEAATVHSQRQLMAAS